MKKKILIILTALTGVTLGSGLFTFHYAEGFSYFSTDPKACANCHIMNDEYESWQKGSHHNAKCVDCHMPHDSITAKLIAKSDNGYRHSTRFTFQDFHEPIMITPRNSAILQANCVRCHEDLTHGIASSGKAEMSCVHCHVHVGHGTPK